ncbi:MAG: ABC transporter permease [Fimbriimonas ginsengisoli]|uniref:Transport permease protein n=1 Tax=Fimbriimonas ginsengisoli TaxID=1005039 RepID=A0A931LUP5_FIMGI|nr:ABC transporter permease [Fimbriimonas ginsengisoli]
MREELARLWQYRELLYSMVNRDLKVRYKNSFLGFLWSLVNPLLTVFVISYIFKTAVGNAGQNFSAYVLAAYLPYMFFSMSIMDATGSILGNISLVKKIYFPREILPLTAIISNFIHFLLALVVFFAYLLVIYILYPGSLPFQATTIYLPFLLLISFLLAAGVGLMASALNTFYEDVKYIVGFVMQMLLFLSPIMYFAERMSHDTPRRYLALNLINPIGILCNAYRKTLLAPQGAYGLPPLPIEWGLIAYAAGLSLVVFVAGYWVFNRFKWKFVERP